MSDQPVPEMTLADWDRAFAELAARHFPTCTLTATCSDKVATVQVDIAKLVEATVRADILGNGPIAQDLRARWNEGFMSPKRVRQIENTPPK